MSYVIQEKAILHDIWYEPDRRALFQGITRSDSVQALRDVLTRHADTTTFDWRQHYRIITADGKPVARFVIRPGRIKETRHRY